MRQRRKYVCNESFEIGHTFLYWGVEKEFNQPLKQGNAKDHSEQTEK